VYVFGADVHTSDVGYFFLFSVVIIPSSSTVLMQIISLPFRHWSYSSNALPHFLPRSKWHPLSAFLGQLLSAIVWT